MYQGHETQGETVELFKPKEPEDKWQPDAVSESELDLCFKGNHWQLGKIEWGPGKGWKLCSDVKLLILMIVSENALVFRESWNTQWWKGISLATYSLMVREKGFFGLT